MHIALLMTNTDESEFAQARPKDGEKFTTMIQSVRPDWAVTVFPVKDGVFPPEGAKFDGWMIGGSPASVHDSDPWVGQLFALIRRLVAAGQPMFGACFGHQAIAIALGGHVARNPGGWVFGLVETEIEGVPLKLYGSHVEQVVDLPPGAVLLGSTAGCPVGSFAIPGRVMTTQYHPEMSHGFIGDLVEEYAEELPPEVVARARSSLAEQADSAVIAERIARFFEGQR
ncbi:type 1 glutamine amidotransferase [Tabrizicola oligotrophica]|uniref:Type 1 glutamine amidotransferase n=1 Tax=Tabrizicola oligotrophica TaxID=2710650 RepID=A0A6M0QS33_9RHOB|nr:type 1 glutamine amidotransferase [Tabrizicola oligotrophica]NEY90247.1 type 1 glutamine amidotransferase [Tabrizicola oligotrophica]